MKLCQVIALEKGTKSRTCERISKVHHDLQKTQLLSGISRTYTPKDDEGERFPPEKTLVQLRAGDAVKSFQTAMVELFDVVATKDWGNCAAKADIVVDGTVLVQAAPVTYMLFLEKQLEDVHTFVKKLPVLDPSENWSLNDVQDCWASDAVETTKTKKVPKNHVKAEATEKHPAQVDVYHEDVVVGHWKTVKFSGAMPAAKVREMLERVEKLQKAVKIAREEANSAVVDPVRAGYKILGYIFQ